MATFPNEPQRKFLRTMLKWVRATPQQIGPQTSQQDNSVRQTCKRRGWVTYDGRYWRITKAGEKVLNGDFTA